jgi:hypothetical protein
VSQLKRAILASEQVNELPDFDHELQVPQATVDRRLRRDCDRTVPQVLVRWSYLPSSPATWEDEEPLRQQFPRAPAWRQAGSQGKGGVTAGISKAAGTTATTSAPVNTDEAEADGGG